MLDRFGLVLLDTKWNRLSVNALVGALETASDCDALELRLPGSLSQLDRDIADLRARGKRPIVGLSFTTWGLQRVREMVGRGDPSVLWVAGGPHPTADPEGTLRLGFQVVVCGEGEVTLLDLLRTIASGEDLADVPGLAVRNEAGEVVFTGRGKPVDMDQFPPFPLRRRRVIGSIEIARGCPFGCGFCQTSHLLGVRPRYRSVETIARFASVVRQRGMRDVRFVAPNAFSYGSPDGRQLNLAALESLLSTLRTTVGPEGRLFFGTFPSEVRPEHVTEATLALVKRFVTNDSLIIGAQSGSDRMLAQCHRGHRVSDVYCAALRTIAAGLMPHVDFIFGLPGETAEDLAETMKTLRELVSMGAIIHAHTFMPLPQTRFADSPPGKIAGRLRALIRELAHNGRLYGIWHRQLREA
jgi:B12-binding domain/radical SAM domain protein